MAAGQRSILDGVGECHKGGAMKVKAEALLRGAGRGSSRGGFLPVRPLRPYQLGAFKNTLTRLWHSAPEDIVDETCLLLRPEGRASS